MSRPDDLPAKHRSHLDDLLARCPHLTTLTQRVHEFAGILTDRRGQTLNAWMTTVDNEDLPALHAFVHGVRMDLPALMAGLTLPYSNGPIKAQIPRSNSSQTQRYRIELATYPETVLIAGLLASPRWRTFPMPHTEAQRLLAQQ